jgi:hypothetical protein
LRQAENYPEEARKSHDKTQGSQSPGHESENFRTRNGNAKPVTFNLGYAKTSYINQNETQEPLEPLISSDPRTHEDPSPNWGAGMPETSSIISLTGHNHVNNWKYLIIQFYFLKYLCSFIKFYIIIIII